MPKVYVLNRHGRPLMPCTPAKARHLLDAGKAKVRHRTPFTIQLLYGSTGYTQEVILGVAPAAKPLVFQLPPKRRNCSPQRSSRATM